MVSSGAVTLDEVAGSLTMLEFACSRCSRGGRLRVSTLLNRYGQRASLLDLRERLAGDCPRLYVATDRCEICYPQLRKP